MEPSRSAGSGTAPHNTDLPSTPPRPDLDVRLKAFYHHLSLCLVLPEISEESFLIRNVERWVERNGLLVQNRLRATRRHF